MTRKKQIKKDLFIDMDGVLAHFWHSPMFTEEERWKDPGKMHEPYFFETLPVIEGANWAVSRFIHSNKFNSINILTKPLKKRWYSYSEKVKWAWANFPELADRMILTQEKGLLAAPNRILIDDTPREWQKPWEEKGGQFIHFNDRLDHRQQWEAIVKELT